MCQFLLMITNLHLVYIIVFVNTHALVTSEKSGENLSYVFWDRVRARNSA